MFYPFPRFAPSEYKNTVSMLSVYSMGYSLLSRILFPIVKVCPDGEFDILTRNTNCGFNLQACMLVE